MSEVTLPVSDETLHAETAPVSERVRSTHMVDFPMPTGQEEAWRFTPVHRFEGLLGDILDNAAMTVTFRDQIIHEGEEVVFSGGVLSGVSVSDAAADTRRVALAGEPFDRAGVVGWNNISQTWDLKLSGITLETVVVELGVAGVGNAAGHLRITSESGARANVVVRHTGAGSLNEIVEIVAAPGSELNVVSLQEWDASAKHLATHLVTLQGDARVQHSVITLGGSLVRISSEVKLPDPHADVSMLGLYFTGSAQHQEHRLYIEHQGEKAKSRVGYKGVLQGMEAHSVWVGDVCIGAAAYGTDSYEYNRNLVLGQGPKVDSVPNLEIHNGEIEGAGHASATGRFDDEQLFYLQSRGIDSVTARRLVVKAFFAELLNEINLPELTKHVLETVDSRLEKEELN